MMEGRSILRYDCRRPKALSEFTATLTRTFSEAADNTSKLPTLLNYLVFWDLASKMAQAPTVIVTQPGFVRAPQNSNWQTSLCDCFSDCGVCLCGTFCFTCLGCQVAADMNECCLCGTTVAMRTLYRTRYGIPGSICDDYMVTLFCPVCSVCQLKRDINRRRAMNAF